MTAYCCHIRKLGLGVLALMVIGAGVAAVLWIRAEEMPSDQRAYWQWVSTINRGESDVVLAEGLELLSENPQMHLLYMRIAQLCLRVEAIAACRDALDAMQPSSPLARLYREAALALLDQDEAVTPWQQLARAPELDPTLARLIVDQTWPESVESVESVWAHQVDIDSTALGAVFGLGYAAVLRSDWAAGEARLKQAAQISPDDPLVYRELGRIYFLTGEPDKLEQVLERGIAAAEVQHDLEQELVLRGNLGWTKFQRQGDINEAEALITRALDQARTLALGRTEGYNLWRLANIFLQQHRYDEAIPLIRSADALYAEHNPNRHSEVSVLHGVLLSNMFRFSDAERVLEEAIDEAKEDRFASVQAEGLVALAQLRFQMGRYAAVHAAAEEALALVQRYQFRDQEITTRMALGDVERRGGNHREADAHYMRVVELSRQTKSNARLREGYLRLGLTALDRRDANTAKLYFEEMLRLVEETGASSRIALAYLGLGHTYIRFGNIAEALRYYDLALEQIPEADVHLYAEAIISKAWATLETERYDEAEALFNEARRIDPTRLLVAYHVAIGLGDVAFSQGQCEVAIGHFQEAEAIEKQRPSPWFHWKALFEKALSHWCLGDMAQAEIAFNQAVDVIETFREDLETSIHRAYFVQDKVRVYEYFAAFLEEQNRHQEAFHYMERARSRSLIDQLYTAQRERPVDMEEVTDQVVELDRRLRALAGEISSGAVAVTTTERSVKRASHLQREYHRADSIYQQVQLSLAAQRSIYTFNPLPADAARATLNEGEAMILYDLRRLGVRGQQRDASVAYVVLPDQILIEKLSVESDQLAETIRWFRQQLGSAENGPGQGWESTAQDLYQALVAPVVAALPASVKHLHVVPEGILYYLPFAALQASDSRFLVEDYTLSVTPSASTLKLSRDRNPRRWDSMLLLADPDGTLPGTRKEVGAIAGIGSSDRRFTLVGEAATQENVVEAAGQFDILHFATHGNFVQQAPWRSSLQMHGGEVLSVEEISQLNLDAYLVTLSACETALSGGLLSEVPDGDEWVGLNQAFLAAGTPTVMASLWPIDDLVSSDFMIDFYRALGPAGKARALAQVQRQFLKNPSTRHPFYWAPFTIMGDPL